MNNYSGCKEINICVLFKVVLQQPVKGILGDVDGAFTEKAEDAWVSSVKNHETSMIEKLSTFKVNFSAFALLIYSNCCCTVMILIRFLIC